MVVKIDDLGVDIMFFTRDESGISKVITEVGVEKGDTEVLPIISEEVKHVDGIGEPGEEGFPVGQVCKQKVGFIAQDVLAIDLKRWTL
jgi:hypothetical protein